MFPIPRRSPPALFRLFAAAIALAPVLSACSDDATAAGPETPADVVDTSTDGDIATTGLPKLQPSSPATGARVEFEGEWDDAAQRMRVRVHIAGFAHLLGIAGHLRFDPAALKLVALTGHPVPLGSASDAMTWDARTLAKESPVGRVLAGGARFRKKPNPYFGPEGATIDRELWLTAEFEVRKPGTHAITFDPASTTARNDGNEEIPATWGSAQIIWQQGGAK